MQLDDIEVEMMHVACSVAARGHSALIFCKSMELRSVRHHKHIVNVQGYQLCSLPHSKPVQLAAQLFANNFKRNDSLSTVVNSRNVITPD